MRDSIKNASMSDLKDFLENIRRHSAHIGEIAMKQARCVIRLHRMHERQTVVTDVNSRCLSVSLSVSHECTK